MNSSILPDQPELFPPSPDKRPTVRSLEAKYNIRIFTVSKYDYGKSPLTSWKYSDPSQQGKEEGPFKNLTLLESYVKLTRKVI